jgi:GNAT superfamily N-acetyltransferase
MPITIRPAKEDDCPLILEFIKGLADYENLSHEVSADEAQVRKTLFGDTGGHRVGECILAFSDDEPAGFALFFHNYSTFLCKPGLYLEDLFVKPEFRGTGLGKLLLVELAKIAMDRECGRMEWWVLDWNTSAIDFYKSIDAVPQDEWTVFRLTEDKIKTLAES